jgi:hypothetical protein
MQFSGNATVSVDLTKDWDSSTVTFNAVNKTQQGAIPWDVGYLWPDSTSSFLQ